jgi:8-oxo-dGTP pyrophosphatase MutT (NUDIX family)
MSQKSATIALINNNKVLLLKRGHSAPWMPNKYCLVGGGVDDNESLIDAAIRETKEEVGVSLDKSLVKDFVVTYSNNYSKTVFLTFVDNINISLNYEHSEYGWFDYSNCTEMYKDRLLVPRLMKTLSSLRSVGVIK